MSFLDAQSLQTPWKQFAKLSYILHSTEGK